MASNTVWTECSSSVSKNDLIMTGISSYVPFNSDDEVVTTPDGRTAHRTIRIDTVISINSITNSPVFEIFP